ncbi:MAG: F0F1 ATP synthase subunit A, partial [Planctomycetaceae bacterium]|nr:F0F1 ATP synthase subunit A [Planctomycetaceae bacterium]
MASDILHIKDSYYFEVPKALAPAHYQSLGDVEDFLLELHEEDFHLDLSRDYDTLSVDQYTEAETHALHEFNEQMSGKILIPQLPGTKLRTLYEAEHGFAISKFMVLELIVAVLMIVIFNWMKKKLITEHPTKGRFANMVEAIMHYVRDEIARKNIGHDADKFVPLLWTVFFFILGCNLIGIIPWTGTATGVWGTTAALAFAMLLATFFAGFRAFGPKWLWTGFVPHMDLPWWLSPLKLMIYGLEVIGMFVKHAVLSIRLLANMAAGHLVLLGLFALAL